jgi:site-specific recombinase XerD
MLQAQEETSSQRGRGEIGRHPPFLQRFIEHLRSHDRSQRTIESYSSDLKLFAKWFYETNREELTLKSMTPIDLREYKRHLLEDRGFKPATVNRRLASISAFCRWAQEQGLADGNPYDEISIVPEVRTAPKWLTKIEQYALIRAVQKGNRPRDEALIMVMLHTGLRVSEVSNLRIGDVSISPRKGEVIVRGGKGGKFRTVPLNSNVRNALKAYLSVHPSVNHDYLFLGQKADQPNPPLQGQPSHAPETAVLEKPPVEVRPYRNRLFLFHSLD